MAEYDIIVQEVKGKKRLGARGANLIGHTQELREKVEDLDIDPEEHEEGSTVATVEIDTDSEGKEAFEEHFNKTVRREYS